MFDVEDSLFLLAGPVKIHPRIQRAMAQPAHAHRSPEFTTTNKKLFTRLQEAYQTNNPVLCLSGSGTAAMDATVGSLIGPQDTAVALDNGKFGNRMAQLAKRYAKDVHHLEAPWGQPIPPEEIENALTDADALLLTHNETSSAFTHPLQDMAQLAREHDALLITDCITSLGGLDVPVDDLGLDACIAGSQKCIGAPAGLSFVSLSEKAQDRLIEHPSFYLDLPKHLDRWHDDQTPFTPATHLHLATLEALEIMLEEGLQARFERIQEIAKATRSAGEALGLELFAANGYRSDTVTAFRMPENITDNQLRGGLKERGVLVAGGQSHMKGKIFRVGHLGQTSLQEIAGFFANLEIVLRNHGAKINPGAWVQTISDIETR